jgi:hypothetical protein
MPLFFGYTLAFALQLMKVTENLSQGSRVGFHLLRQLGLLFRESLDWPAEHQSSFLCVTSACPWLAQVPSKLTK